MRGKKMLQEYRFLLTKNEESTTVMVIGWHIGDEQDALGYIDDRFADWSKTLVSYQQRYRTPEEKPDMLEFGYMLFNK